MRHVLQSSKRVTRKKGESGLTGKERQTYGGVVSLRSGGGIALSASTRPLQVEGNNEMVSRLHMRMADARREGLTRMQGDGDENLKMSFVRTPSGDEEKLRVRIEKKAYLRRPL